MIGRVLSRAAVLAGAVAFAYACAEERAADPSCPLADGGPTTDAAADASLHPPEPPAGIIVGKRRRLAVGERSPLVRKLGGVIAAQLGAQPMSSTDGARFRPRAEPLAGGGSMQLVVEDGSELSAYSYGELLPNEDHHRVAGGAARHSTPFSPPTTTADFRVFGLAALGLPAGHWTATSAARAGDRTYLSLQLNYTQEVDWYGAPAVASLGKIYAAVNRAGSFSDFDVLPQEVMGEATMPAQPIAPLPVYYGVEANAVGLGPDIVGIATRVSADDDDHDTELPTPVRRRSLRAGDIFGTVTEDFDDRQNVMRGSELPVPEVFTPRLDPSGFYGGDREQPRIAWSRSSDGGQSWTRTLLELRGVTPSAAFDAEQGLLVVASGAQRYPRRGHAFQVSRDGGVTFEPPVQLDDAADGRTSGAVSVVALGNRRFLLFYDILSEGVQLRPPAECPARNPYFVYVREIELR